VFLISLIFVAIAYRTDLREPLSKEKVFWAIRMNVTEKTIKRISLMQDWRAGDIGYYFVEFEPEGYRVVINDARFSLFDGAIGGRKTVDMGRPLILVGHIFEYQTAPLRYRSTMRLKMRSLFNLIFNIKTKEQTFWDCY
jgi:hypothetical protein